MTFTLIVPSLPVSTTPAAPGMNSETGSGSPLNFTSYVQSRTSRGVARRPEASIVTVATSSESILSSTNSLASRSLISFVALEAIVARARP